MEEFRVDNMKKIQAFEIKVSSLKEIVSFHWKYRLLWASFECQYKNEFSLSSMTYIYFSQSASESKYIHIDVNRIVLCSILSSISDTERWKMKPLMEAYCCCYASIEFYNNVFRHFQEKRKKNWHKYTPTHTHKHTDTEREKCDHILLLGMNENRMKMWQFCAPASPPSHCSKSHARTTPASILIAHRKRMLVVIKLLCAKNKLNKCVCVDRIITHWQESMLKYDAIYYYMSFVWMVVVVMV